MNSQPFAKAPETINDSVKIKPTQKRIRVVVLTE